MGQIGKNNTANWKHNFKIKRLSGFPTMHMRSKYTLSGM